MIRYDLKKLLEDFIDFEKKTTIKITGISSDSRNMKKGDLFFSYNGTKIDSRVFIKDAIAKHAAAVLYESETGSLYYEKKIPIIPISKLKGKMGRIAAKFYSFPSNDMLVIGITGTNGKTSCTNLLANVFNLMGIKAGVIGTLGYGDPKRLKPLKNTTPGALELQSIFYELKREKYKAIAMEVSSHALDQDRTVGIKFDCGVFTNLTHDHLDYHVNMNNYANAKRKLFDIEGLQHAIINLDDSYGKLWINNIGTKLNACVYSSRLNNDEIVTKIKPEYKHLLADNIKLGKNRMRFSVSGSWGRGIINSKLLGHFNVDNLLAVISTLCMLGYELDNILSLLSKSKTVPGRMEAVGGNNVPLFVVDYAHTPDALWKVLEALQKHCVGRLFCIFGCGGNRDRQKRPEMAKISEQFANQIIVTDDNPRFENPKTIVDDILEGFKNPEKVQVEHNRAKAISLAFERAVPGDIILIAGKGHENYQLIGEKIIPFSDKRIVKQLLSNHLKCPTN